MKKIPKFLYHGSIKKLVGDFLIPKMCLGDMGNNPDEKLNAV
jgi:hypothetical protein